MATSSDDIAIVEMGESHRRQSVVSMADIDEDIVYKNFAQLRQRRKSLTQSMVKTKKKGKAEKTEDSFDIDDYRNGQNAGDFQEFTTPGMIFQHIQKQKQVIQKVRFQPWPMRVKKNTVKTAMSYVSQYEGQLSKKEGYQERGQQYWLKFQRQWNNLVVTLLPWELRIKTIESHFGSSVASYFVFLRWLTAVNLLYALLWLLVILPEILSGDQPGEAARKTVPDGEEIAALDFDTIWDFNGYLKYSVLFYGYYGNSQFLGNGYQLPLAYLLVGLATYAVSFIIILRKMAANSRMSKMSSPNEQFTFCWKVFTGWDFMIGNAETADKTVASNATVLREAIIEMEEKEKQSERKPVTICLRVLANLMIVILLCGSGYAIYQVVLRSQEFEKVDDKSKLSWWEVNEVSIVMTIITFVCPSLFEMIGAMESYHPRVALRWQLARIMVLYMGNLYTLIIALLGRVSNMTKNSRAGLVENRAVLAALEGQLWQVTNQSYLSPYNGTDYYQDRNGSIVELMKNITNVENRLNILGPDDCWETVVGQEFFKLVFFDMIALVLGTLGGDFLRAVLVRYLNYCCCWDLEMKFPQYPEFKIAENVLHLVYNQGMVWMGCFFSPCLPAFNVLKLVTTLYVRAWAVVTCNVPHERIFRASGSNNFYLTLLLLMLFLCVLAFGYSVVAIQPSHNCGPFSNYSSILDVIGNSMEQTFPPWLNSVIDYVNTAGVVVPLLLFLWMAIYYLWALQGSLKDANNDLRIQLEYERTESRNKLYELTAMKNDNKKKTKSKVQPKHGIAVLPSIPPDYQLRKTNRNQDRENAQRENGGAKHAKKNTISSNSNGIRYIPLPTGHELAVVKRSEGEVNPTRIKLAVDEDVIIPDGMRARYYYRGRPVSKEVWTHLKARAMENNRKKLASVSVIPTPSTPPHDNNTMVHNAWLHSDAENDKTKRGKLGTPKRTQKRTDVVQTNIKTNKSKQEGSVDVGYSNKMVSQKGRKGPEKMGKTGVNEQGDITQHWKYDNTVGTAASDQSDRVADDDGALHSVSPVHVGRREPDGQESIREKLQQSSQLPANVEMDTDSSDRTDSEVSYHGNESESPDVRELSDHRSVHSVHGIRSTDDEEQHRQGREFEESSESEFEETDLEEQIGDCDNLLENTSYGNQDDEERIKRSNRPLRNDIELSDVLLSEEKIRRQRQKHSEPLTSQCQSHSEPLTLQGHIQAETSGLFRGHNEPSTSRNIEALTTGRNAKLSTPPSGSDSELSTPQRAKKDVNPMSTWEVNTVKRRAKLFEVEVTSEYAEPFEDADIPILPQEDGEEGGFINPIFAKEHIESEQTVVSTSSHVHNKAQLFTDFYISDEVRSGFGERDNLLQNIRNLRQRDDDDSSSNHSVNAIRETFDAMKRDVPK